MFFLEKKIGQYESSKASTIVLATRQSAQCHTQPFLKPFL